MKKSTLIISLAVFLILLVAVLFVYIDPYKKYKPQKPNVNIPKLTKENIVKIEIKFPEEQKDKDVVLAKEGDKWFIVSVPEKFRVDKNVIDSTLNKLANFEVVGVRSRKKEKHELFEVDDKHAKKITVYTDKGDKFTFYLGKNSKDFRSSFIRLPNDDTVYAVKGALKSYFDREIKNWRDKKLFDFDKNNVQKIVLTVKEGKKTDVKTFERQEDGSWKLAEYPDFPVKKDRVQSLANQIANLRTQEFIDEPKPLKEYGLDAPQITVKITLKDGKEEVLLIGNKTEKNRYYAKVADRDKPLYVLASWQVDRYKKDLDYYEDKEAKSKPEQNANKKSESKKKESKPKANKK